MNHLDRTRPEPVHGVVEVDVDQVVDELVVVALLTPLYKTFHGAERATQGMTGDVKIVPMDPEPYEAKWVGR